MIEMLVSIFILVIITGIITANLRHGAKSDDLRRTATEVNSVLRKAQNLSLIGAQEGLPDGASSNTGIFGVHFDTNQQSQYLLFLDFKNESGENVPDGLYQSGEELPGSVYQLPNQVIFNSLSPSSSGILDVTFSPPKPTIYFNDSREDTSAVIELRQTNTGQSRYLKINLLSGQISIETEL